MAAQKRFENIEPTHREFIEAQHMFFAATAAPDGRVNLAPKGHDSLRVIGPNRIVWLSLTGSENETAAHLKESSRMTLMWCSFEKTPLILRAYGEAAMVYPSDEGWDALAALFPASPATRQFFDLRVDLVLTSCGFGVPLYEYVGQRDTLVKWGERKGPDGVKAFWAERNVESLDGKPTGILQSSS